MNLISFEVDSAILEINSSATTYCCPSASTKAYLILSPRATATLAFRVQGVVVQIRKLIPLSCLKGT